MYRIKPITNTFWSPLNSKSRLNQAFFHPYRRFSDHTKNIHPKISNIYEKLLQQQSSTPISCNFISQIVDHWALDKNKIAIHCVDQDNLRYENITYENIKKRSLQMGWYFTKKGLKKGDSVALMLGQHPVWWYGLAASLRKGIAAIPCPLLLTSKDLIYRINDLKIKSIITTPELQDRINLIRKDCPSLNSLVTTGLPDNNWDSAIDILNSNIIETTEYDTTTEDPCLYLYTSGTTGQPKAVQHNHDYPFFHWPTGKRWLRSTSEDLVYNASDTGWGFTVWITAAVWATGAKLLVTPTTHKFNPARMLTTLEKQQVSIFCAAPTVLRLLVAYEKFDYCHLSHLKRIVTVGEALDETVINKFQSRGIEVNVGYGQAETTLLMGRVDNQPHVPQTMGKPIAPYRIVIIDDKLNQLSPGSVGQIGVDLVEGNKSGIMRRYANAPEKTERAFSPDGRYYLTGDWAKLRKDGLFSYQGRRDDLIKSRGYRIGPDEVEKAGMSHPAIAKIAVVGVRTDPDSVNITVKAFILLKPNYTETQELIEDIQTHIKRETGPYKYPRLVECLPLKEWEKYETTSGKIRRSGLREREEHRLMNATLRTSEISRNVFNH